MDSGITRGKPSQPSRFSFKGLKEKNKNPRNSFSKLSQNPRNPRKGKCSSDFSQTKLLAFDVIGRCTFNAAENFSAMLRANAAGKLPAALRGGA
jgi:hypothetical protein